MNVLLIGGGGREHALAWASRRSPLVERLRCAPGNPGLARHAECLPIAADDLGTLTRHVRAERYDLVVVGPEGPLVAGLSDRIMELGVPCFGPSAAAARLEGSKAFSKQFMQRHGIPTAPFQIFDDARAAESHLASASTTYPLVVKADGLAAGKGVILAATPAQAIAAAQAMLERRDFAEAGSRIVVEDQLAGREVSFFALCDGERVVELEPCQDYKRAQDGDRGANTGGMGSYSPSVYLDAETRRLLLDAVVRPTVRGLALEGAAYRGVLYVGVMLTAEGPKVLEYNARFGDPEAQALLPRLAADWIPLWLASAEGRLAEQPLAWRPDAAVTVVMASGGYPAGFERGVPIAGIEQAEALEDVLVFHAGSAQRPSGGWMTAGGRVLGVTALGADLATARERAYRAVAAIRWPGEHHRSDIAADAVRELTARSSA